VTLAKSGISCLRVLVHPSVTSWCSTETAKCRIMQIMPHDSPEARFLMLKTMAKLKRGHPYGGTKCRWDRLNADTVPKNWRLSTIDTKCCELSLVASLSH